MTAPLTPEAITRLFTRPEGYVFARWGRPIVPVVFGVAEDSLAVVKGAIEAVVALSGHKMAEHDPELGANLMIFFCADWTELLTVPDLDRLVDGLRDLVARLTAAGANQHRMFRFDDTGAIRASFVFLRMDDGLAELPAEDLALDQAVRMVLVWGEEAFDGGTLVVLDGKVVLRPDLAGVIRAAYSPLMPVSARDPSHALRLFARLQAGEAV